MYVLCLPGFVLCLQRIKLNPVIRKYVGMSEIKLNFGQNNKIAEF